MIMFETIDFRDLTFIIGGGDRVEIFKKSIFFS